MLSRRELTSRSLRLQHLLAAEGEELAGEQRAALPGLLDLLRVPPLVLAGARSSRSSSAVEGDRRQQVVEGMGDAPGQPADRLQPLGVAQALLAVPQLLLGGLALGDVAAAPSAGGAGCPAFVGLDVEHHRAGRGRRASRSSDDLQVARRRPVPQLPQEIAEAGRGLGRDEETGSGLPWSRACGTCRAAPRPPGWPPR